MKRIEHKHTSSKALKFSVLLGGYKLSDRLDMLSNMTINLSSRSFGSSGSFNSLSFGAPHPLLQTCPLSVSSCSTILPCLRAWFSRRKTWTSLQSSLHVHLQDVCKLSLAISVFLHLPTCQGSTSRIQTGMCLFNMQWGGRLQAYFLWRGEVKLTLYEFLCFKGIPRRFQGVLRGLRSVCVTANFTSLILAVLNYWTVFSF